MNTYQIYLNNSGKFQIWNTMTQEWVGGEFETHDAAIAFCEGA